MSFLKDLYSLKLEFDIYNKIKKQWNLFMDSFGGDNFYKKYDLLNVIPKSYGFDCIVSIPYGKSLVDFRKVLPSLSSHFNSKVIAEYNEGRKDILVKFNLNSTKIKRKDEIEFKWYSILADKNYRNIYGETFSLKFLKTLYHPVKKKLLLGYKYKINIPEGLSYSLLEELYSDLNKTLGVCILSYDKDRRKAYIEILRKPLSDNEKFETIPVKPYELYVGMTHSYNPIIFNYKHDPNTIWGGKTNTGKTLSMIMGFANLLSQYTSKDVELFIIMLSDKQDLRIFKNLEQCKYYANNIEKALSVLNYLSKECARRNALLEESDKYGSITNIYDYNKSSKEPLPFLYLAVDEIASLSVEGADNLSEKEKNQLVKCNSLVWKLSREGRSVGIFVNMATQRGDIKNLDANIKGNLSNQVAFYFPNMPSALTILGDTEMAKKCLELRTQREFICISDKIYYGKTLYLTLDMVVDLLKPYYEENKVHLNLKLNGDIVPIIKDNDNSKKVIPIKELESPKINEEVALTKSEKTKKIPRFKNWKKEKKAN